MPEHDFRGRQGAGDCGIGSAADREPEKIIGFLNLAPARLL